MNILFCLDNGYAHLLAVAIVSILRNAAEHSSFNFFILHKDLSDDNRDKISSLIKDKNSIYFIKVDEEKYLSDFVQPENWSNKVCYYRLIAPHIIKKYSQQHKLNVEQLLFLDADIIVEGDISPIFETKLLDYTIGAVKTPMNVEERQHFPDLKVDSTHKFIYAGLILCDIRKWIENDIFEQAKKINKAHPEGLKWLDMDMLNIIFSPNKYAIIAPKYSIHPGIKYPGYEWNIDNYLKMYEGVYSEREVKEAFYHPVILQLAGAAKPWRRQAYLKTIWQWFKYSLHTPYYIYGFRYLLKKISGKGEA